MFLKVNATELLRKSTKAYVGLLLIFFYSLGLVKSFSPHQLLHLHKYAEIHSVENEHDGCHISLYHQNQSGKCEHTSHFNTEDKCALCDSEAVNAHVFSSFLTFEKKLSFVGTVCCLNELSIKGLHAYSSSRAPPVA